VVAKRGNGTMKVATGTLYYSTWCIYSILSGIQLPTWKHRESFFVMVEVEEEELQQQQQQQQQQPELQGCPYVILLLG